jgi:hypothetical protein
VDALRAELAQPTEQKLREENQQLQAQKEQMQEGLAVHVSRSSHSE